MPPLKESTQETYRTKDRFLEALSYELRTPLMPVILSVTAHLKDPAISQRLRQDLEMIQRNLELQTKLLDELLDLSSLQSGKSDLIRESVDLNQSVSQAVEIFRSKADKKHIQIHQQLDAMQPILSADAARIHQVLWHIMDNAVQFTSEDGNILISTEKLSDSRVLLVIKDDGIGIDHTILNNLFEDFEHRDRQVGEMGLGLSISKAIVEMHGGIISAKSEGVGFGSEFIIELPIGKLQAKAIKKTTEPVQKPLRILVVEDHPDTATVLYHLLIDLRHHVKVARTAEEAFDKASSEVFDLVISDVGLPDDSGHHLMTKLKDKYALKGIAITGYGRPEDVQRSIAAGFSEHLTKPLDLMLLSQAIRRVASL